MCAEQERFELFTADRLFAHSRWEDGHLVWAGAANGGRTPQVRLGGQAGAVYNVRRVIYALARGPIKDGFRVTAKCDHPLCVHPDHLVANSRSVLQRGKPIPLERRLRIAASKRRASATMTPELARKLRADPRPAKHVDIAYGLRPGTTSKIRRGERWMDLGAMSWLGGFAA